MEKIDPKCKLNQKGKRINVPVSYELGLDPRTQHTGLVPLKGGAWQIYDCEDDNYGYITGADMKRLVGIMAKRLGYRLVKEPPKV